MKNQSTALKEKENCQITEENQKKETQFRMVIHRLVNNKLALTGGIIFLILCLISIFAPLIAPYEYDAIDTAHKFMRPCAEHLLGTDHYGRDILSRIIYGGRWSLTLGVASTLCSTILGIIVGSIAGYFGGKVDMVIMRITDVMQCIPGTIVASIHSSSKIFLISNLLPTWKWIHSSTIFMIFVISLQKRFLLALSIGPIPEAMQRGWIGF